MAFAIIKRPIEIINGHQSKWVPSHQPVIFEVVRRDMQINKVQAIFSGGSISSLRLTINEPLSLFNVKKGDRIRVFSQTITVTYAITNILSNFVFEIKYSGNIPSLGDTLIFLDALHYLEMRVVYTKNNLQYQELGFLKAKTDLEGIARFNVQDLLSTKTINQNNFLYNKINEGQWGEGSRFNIQLRDWNYNKITYLTNDTNNYSRLVNSNVLYYTNSANQIQNKYGYNMGEYVPTLDAGRTDKAKFQSVFKRPTYFPGYPFSLNFIYSDNMTNCYVYKTEETYDINRNIILGTTTNLDFVHRELGNRLMLSGSYTSNIKYVDVYLSRDGTLITQDNYFDGEYTDGYMESPTLNNQYTE